MSEVTQILDQIEQGDPTAASQLLPLVYEELRRLADQKLKGEAPGHTLQPTALVHEAYLRLVDGSTERQWDNRGHFFAAAAEAMRRILVDSARRRKSLKRGGGRAKFQINNDDGVMEMPLLDDFLDLDAALNKLAQEDAELARLVELRFFAGLTVEESAKVLGISPRTVKRNWSFVRAWLGRELHQEE